MLQSYSIVPVEEPGRYHSRVFLYWSRTGQPYPGMDVLTDELRSLIDEAGRDFGFEPSTELRFRQGCPKDVSSPHYAHPEFLMYEGKAYDLHVKVV